MNVSSHQSQVVTLQGTQTFTLLHTEAFAHRSFYTQKLLHTEVFTHKHFHTQELLHTNTFTHRDRTGEIAILLQFLTFNVHFVREGCDGLSNSAIYLVFDVEPPFRV